MAGEAFGADALEQALRLARVGLWDWDPHRDRVRWSLVLRELFGLGSAPADYATFLACIMEDDRAQVEAAIRRCLATGQAFDVRHRVQSGGRTRWIHSRGEAVVEAGRVVLLRGTATDITDTAEADRVREANEVRSTFLNVAAHELKTPLTPLRLQVQLLEMQLKDPPETVQKSLRIMRRGIDRLNELVEDILDAARIQATQLKLRLQPVDLGVAVQESLEAYSQVAAEVGIRLDMEAVPGIVVSADPTRLQQVVHNLLSNAVKFTPAGGRVWVRVSGAGSRALLEVRDTGRGLAPDQAARLFQPFVQVHADAQATKRGTGLGLFIVKAIMEQHGGGIEVGSPGPGQGATFRAWLPLLVGGTPQPPRPKPRLDALSERLRELV